MIESLNHDMNQSRQISIFIYFLCSGRVQARDPDREAVPDRKNLKNLRAENRTVPLRTRHTTKLPPGSVLVEIDLEENL